MKYEYAIFEYIKVKDGSNIRKKRTKSKEIYEKVIKEQKPQKADFRLS